MNIFHHDLESVEAASLRDLDLRHETLSKVFKDNAVRGCEEGEHILEEVLLFFVEFLPVLDILHEIDLLDCPEGGHLILVHLPDVVVLDWEHDESVGVFFEERLGKWCLSLREVRVLRCRIKLALELRAYWLL